MEAISQLQGERIGHVSDCRLAAELEQPSPRSSFTLIICTSLMALCLSRSVPCPGSMKIVCVLPVLKFSSLLSFKLKLFRATALRS